jgi:hypothetical protein
VRLPLFPLSNIDIDITNLNLLGEGECALTKQKVFGELILKTVLLLYGLYYFIETIIMDISVNAKVYPFIIDLAFVIVMIRLIIDPLKKFLELLKTDRQPLIVITPESIRLISTYLAGIILIALTLMLNFWIALIVVLPLTIYILENRKASLATLIFLPVGMIVTVYLVFIKFLGLRLPMGF